MKVVFVSGAYRGNVTENIEKARQVAIKLWQMGYVALCPHMNTAHFDGICDDSVWLAGDIELLKRCDAISMVDNWQHSEGAKIEYEIALNLGKEFITVEV